MKATLLALAACGGERSVTIDPADAPPADAAPAFTYTAKLDVKPGITRATMNGVDLPPAGGYFIVVETFPDYATGIASPDVALQFFVGDELTLQGNVGPGACRRSAFNCPTGTLISETVEPKWWQDFTRNDYGVIICTGTEGSCALPGD